MPLIDAIPPRSAPQKNDAKATKSSVLIAAKSGVYVPNTTNNMAPLMPGTNIAITARLPDKKKCVIDIFLMTIICMASNPINTINPQSPKKNNGCMHCLTKGCGVGNIFTAFKDPSTRRQWHRAPMLHGGS